MADTKYRDGGERKRDWTFGANRLPALEIPGLPV
jgi:hypothetical protein